MDADYFIQLDRDEYRRAIQNVENENSQCEKYITTPTYSASFDKREPCFDDENDSSEDEKSWFLVWVLCDIYFTENDICSSFTGIKFYLN